MGSRVRKLLRARIFGKIQRVKRRTDSCASKTLETARPDKRVQKTSLSHLRGKIGLALVSPFLVFALIELVLRITGFGYPTGFFIRTPDGEGYTLNERFRRQFYPKQQSVRGHPFRIAQAKPTNTFRIFVFGESAALGTPNPSFGFARILGVMLRESYPQYKFEIINTAMRGINSHIVRRIAFDSTQHAPDIAIVYAGNNEVVGFAAPSPSSPLVLHNRTLIRAGQALRQTKFAQLLELVANRIRPAGPIQQDMDYFRQHRLAFDDPRRQLVYRNFRANIEDICRALTSAKATVLLSTVPVNIFDCPPLGSLHRHSLSDTEKAEWERVYKKGCDLELNGDALAALEFFQRAAKIDDHFAELHFRMARCLFNLDRFSEAGHHFKLALDRDALQFRADTPINDAIRAIAGKYRDACVRLVDAEKAMADSPLSVRGLPGNELFLDHVHPRFAGDYLLALTFYNAIGAILSQHSNQSTPTRPPPSMEFCARALAFTGWDELEIDAAIAQMLKRPPFLDQLDLQARIRRIEEKIKAREIYYNERGIEHDLETYRQALQRAPDDWELHHNFGMILRTIGRYDAAVPHFKIAVERFPDSVWCIFHLAETLAKARRFAEAEQYLYRIVRLDPDFQPAKAMLAQLRKTP